MIGPRQYKYNWRTPLYGHFIGSSAAVVLYLCCSSFAHAGDGHVAPSANGEVELTTISALISRIQQIQQHGISHKYRNDTEMAKNIEKILPNLENPDVFFPPGIQEKIISGVHLWDLAVGSHRESNKHHNYATTDRAVAQEIALDFFSSSLVSCLLVDVPITAGRIQRAYTSIHRWPNFVNGSSTVREGVAFMGRAMFRHYGVTDETEEVDIPEKPYTVAVAKYRNASDRLVEMWRNITGNEEFAKGKQVKETDILFELVKYFKNNIAADCQKAWKRMLPLMLEDTELGKWLEEVNGHKKLVVDFHQNCREATGYEVTDAVAEAHDNDKYIPFNLLAYTLNWYYGDVGIMA